MQELSGQFRDFNSKIIEIEIKSLEYKLRELKSLRRNYLPVIKHEIRESLDSSSSTQQDSITLGVRFQKFLIFQESHNRADLYRYLFIETRLNSEKMSESPEFKEERVGTFANSVEDIPWAPKETNIFKELARDIRRSYAAVCSAIGSLSDMRKLISEEHEGRIVLEEIKKLNYPDPNDPKRQFEDEVTRLQFPGRPKDYRTARSGSGANVNFEYRFSYPDKN
tara:strand:- start:405 stop:1073 length:669 start_codon:yes stop_codon:yes gene_type:complete